MLEHRIVGFDGVEVNLATSELHFVLTTPDRMAFVASFQVATELTEALGQAVSESRREIPSAVRVVSFEVREDHSEKQVVMFLPTDTGVPYNLAMSPEVAAKLGEQLKARSSAVSVCIGGMQWRD
jgi:hypothetical protein